MNNLGIIGTVLLCVLVVCTVLFLLGR